jgi:hypothetical protein
MALYGEWRLKQAAGIDAHGPDASVTSVRVLREFPSQGTVRARKAANQHNTKLEENGEKELSGHLLLYCYERAMCFCRGLKLADEAREAFAANGFRCFPCFY